MFWNNEIQNILASSITKDEAGQDLAEYALILVFVVVVCVIGVSTLGNTVIEVYLNRVLTIFG